MLDKMEEEIRNCTKCRLCETRTNAVVGEGIKNADIMLVGEAPGADEDEKGIPFIGRSGRLLTQMLSDVGISREKNLFITNTVKCRPPLNRNPLKDETLACSDYLRRQTEVINPKVIILVGNYACRYFLGNKAQISKLHGEPIEHEGRILFPVYHPAAILRNIKLKPDMEQDLLKLKKYI